MAEPNPNIDPFQQEVLSLFAVEAQEWLGQIDTALHELESGPAPFRCTKLFETIRNGVTNLGGSAATVELSGIEQLTFALLPHLDAIEGQGRVTSAGQCAALREALDALKVGVQRMAQEAGVTVTLSPPATTPAVEPAPPAAPSIPIAPAAPKPVALTGPVVDALLEVQQSRSESAEATRHLVASMVQPGGTGSGTVTGDQATIRRILGELEALDTELYADIQQRMPNITLAVSGFKREGQSFTLNGNLEGLLQDIAHLREVALTAGATSVTQFFKGLHTFLTLVSRQRVTVPPQRFEAVEAKLGTVLTMTQQWVDIGRMKKANVEQFLKA